jgi:hypothetical protein
VWATWEKRRQGIHNEAAETQRLNEGANAGVGGTYFAHEDVDRGVKLLVSVVLATVCLVVPSAFGRSAVVCSSPGDWPHTKDAAWLARALTTAGLGSFGCTGSAFVVDLGGPASSGQLYVWANRGPEAEPNALAHPSAHTRIAGVIVRYDGVRGLWRARGRNVWVQTASSRRLLPAHRWARIVRATLATPS